MEISLRRIERDGAATIGELLIDGRWFCWTLEDQVRARKIAGKTAIPAGRYRVSVTWSNRFKQQMPLVNDVPDFLGIRIHPGNDAEDTAGCILVGKQRAGARIGQSREAYRELFEHITAAVAVGVVRLTITQPADWPVWGDQPAPAPAPAPATVATAPPALIPVPQVDSLPSPAPPPAAETAPGRDVDWLRLVSNQGAVIVGQMALLLQSGIPLREALHAAVGAAIANLYGLIQKPIHRSRT